AEQMDKARAALAELLGEHPRAEDWQRHLEQQVEHARTGEAETAEQLQQARTHALQLAGELKANSARQQALDHEHQQLQGE
ncbi:hypothetical protein, partial [Pseudomonas sp. SIMBA_068]